MRIKPNQLPEFINKRVYLRLLTNRSVSERLTDIDKKDRPIVIKVIGPTLLYCALPHDGTEMKLLKENIDKKWALFSEYGETMSNDGRDTCLKCGCPTEMRRDFLTFVVRLFCPRCHL